MYLRIRKAREEQGYTSERFAEKLDVSVSYLAELERGRTGISVKMLIKVCNLLGLSADYVLFGNERKQDEQRLDASLSKARRWTGRIEYSNNDISRIGQQNERDKRSQSTEVGEQGFRPNEGSGEGARRILSDSDKKDRIFG